MDHIQDRGPRGILLAKVGIPEAPLPGQEPLLLGGGGQAESGLSDSAGFYLHEDSHKGTEERTPGQRPGSAHLHAGATKARAAATSGFEQKLALLCSCLSQGQSPSRERNKGSSSPIQPPSARQALLRTGQEGREVSRSAPQAVPGGHQGSSKAFFPPGAGAAPAWRNQPASGQPD